MKHYVIGVDYGTDSCRAVLIDTADGTELSASVFYYPRWKEEKYCNPSIFQYRQHPLDYIEGLKSTIQHIVAEQPKDIVENIIAISIDTTGSTVCPVNEEGIPLALLEGFAENPNAMFLLWKDHTAVAEAERINWVAKNESPVDYTKYVGGVYSSEWFFAKILHVLESDETIRRGAYSWVEHCDYIPALLTGVKKSTDIRRSRCAAGHKAMWNETFGGLPPDEFFVQVSPLLDGLRTRLYEDTLPSDQSAGTLCAEWAEILGLPKTVQVGIGAFDCHMGAVGGNITAHTLVKVMGTSTCDIMVASHEEMQDVVVEGICGQVDGSVLPGMIGLEAGQSAFGDVYDWFKEMLAWSYDLLPEATISKDTIEQIKDTMLFQLEKAALALEDNESTVLSLDWVNGRRTPFANQKLKGAITNITLGTTAPEIYKSLIEATAFGAKAINDTFTKHGIAIDEVIAIGGVAKKSPLNMQTLSNVLQLPVKVCASTQTVALGAAIFAAVVGGAYQTMADAQRAMASSIETTYYPEKEKVALYEKKYAAYLSLAQYTETVCNQGKGN